MDETGDRMAAKGWNAPTGQDSNDSYHERKDEPWGEKTRDGWRGLGKTYKAG